MELSKIEKPNARLYIEIEQDKLTKEYSLIEYYRTEDNGAFTNAEKFTRWGHLGDPEFFHQNETHLSNKKFDKSKPHSTELSDYKKFEEVITEILKDMHLHNDSYAEIHLRINGKDFIAGEHDTGLGNSTSISIDQAKQIVGLILKNRVCAELVDGQYQVRDWAKSLNWHFGQQVHDKPGAAITQIQVTDILKEQGIKI